MERDIIVGVVESLCDSIYVIDVFSSAASATGNCVRVPLRIEEESPYYPDLMSGTVVRVRVLQDNKKADKDSDSSNNNNNNNNEGVHKYAILDTNDDDGYEGRCARPPILGQPGSAVAASFSLACRYGLDPCFPRDVMKEVELITRSPGIDDDPRLRDMTSVPFVTVDGAGTEDLDQAMHIAYDKAHNVFTVRYALADASYYVRPGTALFSEALRRGGSVYLPGLCVPMLPAELSEDIISLREGVPRRSVIFEMRVSGSSGALLGTEVYRARIVNHRQLTYNDVDEFHRPGSATAVRLAGEPFADTLVQLRALGELRIAAQNAKNVLKFQRVNCVVSTGNAVGTTFSLLTDERLAAEKWNEQLSLLCNMAGAALLVDAGHTADIHGIWVLSTPPSAKVYSFMESYTREIACIHGEMENEGMTAGTAGVTVTEGSKWVWRKDSESLADYVARLPRITVGMAAPSELIREARISKALNRTAMLCCSPSEVRPYPGAHHCIGAEAYARFSAPMRQIEGIFLHRELLKAVAAAQAQAQAQAPPQQQLQPQPEPPAQTITFSLDSKPLSINKDEPQPVMIELDNDQDDREGNTDSINSGQKIILNEDNDTNNVNNNTRDNNNNNGNCSSSTFGGEIKVFDVQRMMIESQQESATMALSASLCFRVPKSVLMPDVEKLRDDVIAAAAAVKKTQGLVTKAANKIALDTVFAADLIWPVFARPIRRGTVLGVSKDKNRVYVELDNPPIEVKIYLGPLNSTTGSAARINPSVTSFNIGTKMYRVGDEIGVRVIRASDSEIKWATTKAEPEKKPVLDDKQKWLEKQKEKQKKQQQQQQHVPDETTPQQQQQHAPDEKKEKEASKKLEDNSGTADTKKEEKKPKKSEGAQKKPKQKQQPKQQQQQQQKHIKKYNESENELWILEPIDVRVRNRKGASKPHWTKEMNKLSISNSFSIGTPMHTAKK